MKLVFSYSKLMQRWSAQLISLGIVIPDLLSLLIDLLNFFADNASLVPNLSADAKAWIRIVCMVGALIVLPIQQKKLKMQREREEARAIQQGRAQP